MAQRLNNNPPEHVKMRRLAKAEKYMEYSPEELIDLLTKGNPAEGTTPAQESRRMLAFCVIAIRGLLKK